MLTFFFFKPVYFVITIHIGILGYWGCDIILGGCDKIFYTCCWPEVLVIFCKWLSPWCTNTFSTCGNTLNYCMWTEPSGTQEGKVKSGGARTGKVREKQTALGIRQWGTEMSVLRPPTYWRLEWWDCFTHCMSWSLISQIRVNNNNNNNKTPFN